MRQRDFDRIMYKECGLTFHFDSQRLTINNLASSIWGGDQRITSRLTRPTNVLNQAVLLIMNDGVSYRVDPPSLPDSAFSNDQFEINGPMERTRQVPLPLAARDGAPVFVSPWTTRPITWATGRSASNWSLTLNKQPSNIWRVTARRTLSTSAPK